MKDKITLGVIVGNRGFFPGHLIDQGRLAILKVLQEEGIEAVVLSPEATPHGGVGTLNALTCLKPTGMKLTVSWLRCLILGMKSRWPMRFVCLSCACRFWCMLSTMT
jgi:hypothetical protein